MISIFPSDKYQEYLKNTGVESEKKLGDLEIECIVKQAFAEFKKDKLSLDGFCSLGEYLFYKIKEQSSKLASILLDCSELNYAIQIEDQDTDEFNSVMKRVEEYLE